MTIRVLVADDHEIFLEGMRAILKEASDIEIVGYAKDGLGAVELALQEEPDVTVMDISMPGMNGLEATRRIRSDLPATKVLCLSVHGEESFLAAALAAGASGYVLKEGALEELVDGIRAIQSTGSYLSPAFTPMVVQGYLTRNTGEKVSRLSRLTARERETLQLIAEGYPTKQIADRLRVSIKTVSTHREHMMEKLAIHSIAGLTKYAVRAGLTALDSDSPV